MYRNWRVYECLTYKKEILNYTEKKKNIVDETEENQNKIVGFFGRKKKPKSTMLVIQYKKKRCK